MTFKKVTMDTWIHEVVNNPHDGEKISAIQCVHKEGSKETEVWSCKIQPDERINPQDLAGIFQRKAQTHVQGISGYQQFFLYAYYGPRQEWQARLPFMVENASEVSYGTTEPPTAEGISQQRMRQGEAAFQFWGQQVANLISQTIRYSEVVSADRHKLASENMEAFAAMKDMALAMIKANNEHELKKMAYQRETELMSAAAKIGPSLLNSIAGKEIIPQSTVDTQLMEALLDKVTPQQIEALKMILPPEIMGPLMARAVEHEKKKLEANKSAYEAVEGRDDPVLDS